MLYLSNLGLWPDDGARIAAIIADGRRVDNMSCSNADGLLAISWSSFIMANCNGVFVPDPDDACWWW